MSSVFIVGEGRLADTVCQYLPGYTIIRRPDFSEGVPEAKLVLVLQEEEQEDSSLSRQAERILLPLGIPWLCAYISLGEGVIGPLVRPGETGCFQCAEARLSMAGSHRKEVEEMLMKLVDPDYIPSFQGRPLAAGLTYMAHIVAREAVKIMRGDRTNCEEHVYLVHLGTLECTIHYILPRGACPACGHMPGDTPESAEIQLKPCRKLGQSYRCRSMDDLQDILTKNYWDRRTGFFNDKYWDMASPFASVAFNLPVGYYDEVTGGRSESYKSSELAALLEGMERYCGIEPRGKRTVVFDSYARLQDVAIDPARVGFHAEEQYEQADFSFKRFDPDSSMEWVWGYSFLERRPVLIPKQLAYYSMSDGGGFVYETSNGCAVGGSLEEAILYGILEVVERDSFLMTWYARLPVPRLQHSSSGDVELSLMISRVQAVMGYEVHLYNTTMENGIPSIWALAKGSSEQGVNLLCAAGAHLDPVRAAKSAVHELASLLPFAEKRRREREEEAEAMLDDSFLVEHMEDHSLLYSLPQAEERLRFLLDGQRPLRTFAEEFRPFPANEDLTEDLKSVLQVFRDLQLDVIVVDQSSKETLRHGLHCVKVLIPGMLPMTFGHQLTRLNGLDRVLDVPMKLGYASRRLTPEDLNPYPHPFP